VTYSNLIWLHTSLALYRYFSCYASSFDSPLVVIHLCFLWCPHSSPTLTSSPWSWVALKREPSSSTSYCTPLKWPWKSHHPHYPDWTVYPLVLPVLYLCPFPSLTHLTLKMNVPRFSKTLVSYITIWCHDPQDHNFNIHHCRNLISQIKHESHRLPFHTIKLTALFIKIINVSKDQFHRD